MKKSIYILLLILAIFIAICLSVFYLLKRNTLKQLKEKDANIGLMWEAIFHKMTTRLNHLDELSLVKGTGCSSDSLRIAILENKKERNVGEVKALWLLEYRTNQQYVKVGPCYAKKPKLKGKLQVLINSAEELNQLLDSYDAYVREFNLYYSTFPNFLFAKEGGFKRRKFFDLKYGQDNEAIFIEKKKIEKWIETGEL